MIATSRYWDHERCSWVAYVTTAVPSSTDAGAEAAAEVLPEQRADETAAAPTLGSLTTLPPGK